MDTTLLAVTLLATAVILAVVGVLAVIERLPRNRVLGLRATSMREDDEAWRLGHRAAGATLIAAAGPPLLVGLALLVSPPDKVDDWFLVYAVVGILTGGLIALAGRQAANAVKASGPDDRT